MLFAVQVETKSGFTVRDRSALFTGAYLANPRHSTYDVHPDGQRFIFITGDSDDTGELMLVQNVMAPAARPQSDEPKR